MIHHIVQFALRQRFLILMFALLVLVVGALSFQRMPVDAYPDLSPPLVEVITQWPGHAAEEIERLVTLPIELQMNGVPHMVFMRSISLYGLSDVIMTFEDNTDDYFARQVVFERLSTASLPPNVTGSLAPLDQPYDYPPGDVVAATQRPQAMEPALAPNTGVAWLRAAYLASTLRDDTMGYRGLERFCALARGGATIASTTA